MNEPLSTMALLHAGCALLYLGLAALILIRRPWSRTALWLGGACLVTAAWGLSVAVAAGYGRSTAPASFGSLASWLEIARSAAWYGFILHLYRRTVSAHRQIRQAFTTMGLLALVLVGGLPLIDLLSSQTTTTLWSAGIAIRLGFAVCNILLLENLYFNTPPDLRWHINLLCVALAGLFVYDLLLYSDAALFRRISRQLFEGRASAVALAAPLIAIAAARNRRWTIDIHVSRGVVFHTATLVVSGIFLLGLAVTGEIMRRSGSEWGNVAEVTLIFAGVLTIAVLLTSGSARSRIRSLLVDNFFSHRYDYRREWMRCIDTLTAPAAYVSLPVRAVHAVAEVVDSPAGALFVRASNEVAFQWTGSWNMPAATRPIPPGHALIGEFRDADWIVELDKKAQVTEWTGELPRTWLAVPLNHRGELIGFVVLARSRAQFKLDREVFDLLRIIGREVAGRVAEQLAAQVLSQTQQLREYSQRFAFVIHDIKNVSGQLSMLLTNAEVHADNPEFQRDMLATVRASVGKITRLLTRLQASRQERSHSLIHPVQRLRDIIAATRQISAAALDLSADGSNSGVAMDPEAFDAVVQHLLNNAIEASGNARTVRLMLRNEALSVVVDIVDEGPGMTPEFIRDELFRPFSTTKGGGHGIGAYQARELLRAAGGDLLVLSRRPGGTTMRLLLPAVRLCAVNPMTLSA
ncbi:MAG TPA: XrtA/PEP-CTERM system histidine kinase PrsK [Acetobacteraceae bacterium]|nr:XrtA/PEP-CTERM system histidine kinase PrsK [Acetobacteraceae bacterium]